VLNCTAGTDVVDTAEEQLDDGVYKYAQALLCYGLLDLCHRDVIREADGLGMMAMWRINMIRFWAGRHHKYLRAGHRLLAVMQVYRLRSHCYRLLGNVASLCNSVQTYCI